jgi:hypothetical protein
LTLLAAIADSFVNPAILGGLVLLSAPIIIHLLNKRHFQIVPWAAMDFLLQAESRNRRRLRLEDLILLLLRMLIIGLIVFAVARPLLKGVGAPREEERIVILDDSFSMEASDAGGTAFSFAKQAAVSQIEDAVGRSVPVSLWFGTRPESGGLDLAFDAEEGASSASEPESAARAAGLLAAVREAPASAVRLRLAPLFDRLAERLGESKSGGIRSVVIASDFRAGDWLEGEGAERSALRSELAASFAELERKGILEKLRFRFVDVGSSSRENAFVKDVRASVDHPIAKVPTRILIDIENGGSSERRFVTGELEVGDPESLAASPASDGAAAGASAGAGAAEVPGSFRALHRIPLPSIESIAAGRSATVEIEFTFEKAGKYPIAVRIEGDRMPRDDGAYAVVDVSEGVRILIVDGDPGTSRFTGEAGFLSAALAPRGLPTGLLPRRITGEITARDLEDAGAVLVLNRERLRPAEVRLLDEFAREGGGIGFFLGSRVSAEAYAESFPAAGEGAARGGPAGLFPATLGKVKDAEGPRIRLRIADAAHPAFEPFRGIEGSSLEQVGFDRFFEIEPQGGARIAARFTDTASTPAIIERSAGKGRAAIFNLSADRDWNDWPADPSYPVVLQEWARYLARTGAAESSFTVGDPLSWEAAPGLEYIVTAPGGKGATVRPEGGRAVFAGAREHGLYRIVPRAVAGSEAPRRALEPFWRAGRLDPAESDLEPAGEERLRKALGGAGVEFTMGRDVDVDVFRKSEEGETWRALASCAGIFLVIELLAAWWFGRR